MTSSTNIIQTLVRPDVEYVGDDHAFIQPLVVTIRFSGPLPQHLVHKQIEPVEISVSIPKEYYDFTVPVVHARPWSVYQSEQPQSITSLPNTPQCAVSNDIDMESRHQDPAIPFLPLPTAFDHADPLEWGKLYKQIQHWLITDVQNSSLPLWSWGRDAFWMAFIGAHPAFPGGKWAFWDTRIYLEGTFIHEWLTDYNTGKADLDVSSDNCDTSDIGDDTTVPDYSATLSYVWDAFSRHIPLFYPFPLTETSD